MRQVWPPKEGSATAPAVCQSRSNRLAFSHPSALPLLGFGLTMLVPGLGCAIFAQSPLRTFGVVLSLAAALLLMAGIVSTVRWLREDRIARTGEEAWATVTELKAGRTSITYRRPYKLRYRYRDANGTEHEGRARVIGSTWDKYAGEQVLIRYDREHPGLSAVVWNDLGQTTSYR